MVEYYDLYAVCKHYFVCDNCRTTALAQGHDLGGRLYPDDALASHVLERVLHFRVRQNVSLGVSGVDGC